ncbi:MAG TPA: hypothetical protein VIW48_07040, partial [Nitrospiraceae bacterium]
MHVMGRIGFMGFGIALVGCLSGATTTTGPPPPITFVQANSAIPQTPQTSVTIAYTAAQKAGDLNVV